MTKYRFFKSFGTEIAKVRALPGGSVGFRTVRRKMLLWVDFVSQPLKICPERGQGPVVPEVIEAESTRLILLVFKKLSVPKGIFKK